MRWFASPLDRASGHAPVRAFGVRQHRGAWAWLALGMASSIVLGPASAHAFCRSTTCASDCQPDLDDCKTLGFPLYWTSMCVGFSLQKDGSVNIPITDVRRVVEASFVAWADVECATGTATLAFTELADVSCNKAEYNPSGQNANLILFQDYKWNYTGEFNTLGKTTVTYDSATGEILDADIELNHAFNELTTNDTHVVYDLQSILTHEIGHFIGLDHSSDPYATMTPGYQQGSIELRTIEPDDVAGVCTIYPPERAAVCAPNPRGGLGDLCEAAAEEQDAGCSCRLASPARGRSNGLFVLALLGLGFAWRRARRRTA
jgi:MYXO-CTERM domain-containing protein